MWILDILLPKLPKGRKLLTCLKSHFRQITFWLHIEGKLKEHKTIPLEFRRYYLSAQWRTDWLMQWISLYYPSSGLHWYKVRTEIIWSEYWQMLSRHISNHPLIKVRYIHCHTPASLSANTCWYFSVNSKSSFSDLSVRFELLRFSPVSWEIKKFNNSASPECSL